MCTGAIPFLYLFYINLRIYSRMRQNSQSTVRYFSYNLIMVSNQPKNLLQNEAEQSINHQVLFKSKFYNFTKCFSCIWNHPSGDFQAQFYNGLKCSSSIRNRSSSAKKASNLATILILIGDNFTFVIPAFCSSCLGKLFLISNLNFWLFLPWAISAILS